MSKNTDYQSENTDVLIEYWKQQLAAMPPLLELPFNNPHLPDSPYDKAHLSFTISQSCCDALNELSRQSGTTLFMTLLASYKTLLYRYTNQEDIVIGCPITYQNINNEGELKTCLLNTLVLRTDLSGNPIFRELQARISKVVLGAFANKDLPFEMLEEVLNLEQNAHTASLFQVVFAFQNGGDSSVETDDLIRISRKENTQLASPHLGLNLEDTTHGLIGVWEYNAHLFDAGTIERMAENFQILLAGIVAQPDQPISTLPLLSEPERHKLMFEWNNTYAKYPEGKCIHELFEQQVKKTPNALAVIFESEKLTYRELNERSNQLAHYLRQMGVKEETLVPICMKRSLEMIIGILAILKAGGAYVPMDPEYPQSRIQHMLQDTNAPMVLSSTESLQLLNTQNTPVKVIDIMACWHIIRQGPTLNPVRVAMASNLAYVIYTSGSTGIPKGVMIEHASACSFISWCHQEFLSSRFETVYAATSICFDLSVFEIFFSLSIGKPFRILENGLHIGKYLPVDSAVLVNTVPSIVQNLLWEGVDLSNISVLNMAGEPIPLQVQQAVDSDKMEIRNLYGPTEDTTYSTVFRLKNGVPVLIGRPVTNTKIYILNKAKQLTPIGVAGEIYIGGSGLARGYLNRPDLTAQRFVSDPFSNDVNSRLYKTGDSGRFLSDGNIAFLGRLDHQVKIRGYRIELGEIESTISQYPSVEQVVVIAREDTPGDKRLVAYIIVSGDNKPSSGDLRRYLKETLPEYMVPSAFVLMKVLPLTPNGKVDRSALPVPDQHRPGLEKAFLPPRNRLERRLTKIFEECLKIHPIGVQDNFFDLGAHSIQAAHIFSRIRKTMGKQLHLAILLKAPTIEELALLIRRKDKAAPWSALVPLQPNGSKPPLFCIHGGIGTVLFYRDLANNLGPDQPFYGLQAKGLNGIGVPHTCIEDMATYYIDEIRKIQPEGPYYLGGYCFGGIVAFEMAKQLTGQGHEVALLANFNAVSPTYVHTRIMAIEMETPQEDQPIQSPAEKIPVETEKHEQINTMTKIIYLFKRLEKKVKNRAQWQMKLWIYKYCFKYGRPLPEALAKFYLWETNTDMVKAYRPQPYDGTMVIFRSPAIYLDPHLGWTGFVKGNIETCDIPGEHENRRHILVEPFAPVLAASLKKYLETKHQKSTNQTGPFQPLSQIN